MQSERGQTGPVDGSCPGVEVGGHPFLPPGPCSPTSPGLPDEMGDLAFDDGPVGPVALDPAGFSLLGPSLLQHGLVGMDGDGATGAWLGAGPAQGAGPTVDLERRSSTTVTGGVDGDPLSGRTGHGPCLEVDIEAVLGEQARWRCAPAGTWR